jgi:galactoside O-acetyltransferase
MAWRSRTQLERMGFQSLGDDVRISERCSLYGVEHIRIGAHVRIDDFAVITAREPVIIGSHCHISAHVYIGGTYGVEMADFVNLSVGAAVFTSCDDFSGDNLIGPTIPERFRACTNGPVRFGRQSGAGAHSVILPNVCFAEGSAAGALTLVHRSLEAWTIYLGVPMRRLKKRSRRLLELEAELRAEEGAARALALNC